MSAAAPSDWRLQVHGQLKSTQDTAIRAALDGEPDRLAVLAGLQVSGRGSRGRAWQAPPGNLNLSVLLRPHCAPPRPGHWAMLAGVALYDALAPHADGLMLKWPNDVLLAGAKLGGVLIDSAVNADGLLEWVVIGFGANLAEAPVVEGRLVACLPGPGLPRSGPSAREIALSVLQHLDRHESGDVRAAWLARGHRPGTAIDVHTSQRRISGCFEGLTTAGELLLQGDPVPISSAEIFLSSSPARDDRQTLRSPLDACC